MSKKSREKTPELEEIAAQLGNMNTQEEDTITIPVVEIFRQLKKYFLPWVLVAVIFAGLVFGGSMVVSSSKASPLTAMVGFTFDGIEMDAYYNCPGMVADKTAFALQMGLGGVMIFPLNADRPHGNLLCLTDAIRRTIEERVE